MLISVRDLADGHVKRLTEAFGDGITELQRTQVHRAAELLALATAMRGNAVDGSGVDLAELVKVEAMADEAVGKLDIPAPLSKPVEPLTVKFIAPRLDHLSDTELDELERLCAKLRDGPGDDVPDGNDDATAAELRSQVRELLALNQQLRDMLKRAGERASIAEQSEQMYRGLAERASNECAELRKQLEARAPAGPDIAPAAAAESSKAVPAPVNANVVPIRSAPALAFDPIISCGPAPHLDARKTDWPEY
jgi:hypothetical protein